MFKRFTLIVVAAVCTTIVRGNNDKLLSQMAVVNAEWRHQPERFAALGNVDVSQNKNFTDWIATHLMLVEQTLRARDVSHLDASQQEQRAALLDALHGYWQAKRFPINDYLAYKNPVFIDRKGTHCAVGYLMQQSGAEDLARAIDAREKFAYVHEITTPGVGAWASAHGFTVDELAWIQPGYPAMVPTFDLDGGLNGTVNVVLPDASGTSVYVGGSFTQSISGINASNIAVWQNGIAGYDWMDIGGTNGEVNALLLDGNLLYVGGNFTMAGSTTVMNIAVYDLVNATWQSLGVLGGTVRALAKFNGDLYAGGDFTELVMKWNGTQWTALPASLIYGNNVRTLDVWNNLLVFGGDFEWATGAPRQNTGAFDGTYLQPLGFGTLTPVNDFAVFENKLFAACDVADGTDTCALASFDGMDWQVELGVSEGMFTWFSGRSINHLEAAGDFLYAGGDFNVASGMTYGKGMMQIQRWYEEPEDSVGFLYLNPLLTTDSTVNSFSIQSGNVIFGGAFIGNSYGYDTLNHIGQMQVTVSAVKEPGSSAAISLWPNPASGLLNVQSQNELMEQLSVYDLRGTKLLQQSSASQLQVLDVSRLAAGVYLLRAQAGGTVINTRFVKQ